MDQNLTTFYIVRHGQVDANITGHLLGMSDVPLNETGKKQARELAGILKHIHFDEVFSSDLTRALHTAEAIALDRNLVIKTSEALREKSYGKYEGRLRKEVEQELKDLFEKREALTENEKMAFTLYEGGESDEAALSRFMVKLREIAIAYPGKTVLIVCHGGIIRYFLIKLGFAKYNELPPDAVPNTSYLKVESDGVDFFIKETYKIKKTR